jgi:hypothetical protein
VSSVVAQVVVNTLIREFESYSAHHLFNTLTIRYQITSLFFNRLNDAWSVWRSDNENCLQHSAKLQSIPRRETEPIVLAN